MPARAQPKFSFPDREDHFRQHHAWPISLETLVRDALNGDQFRSLPWRNHNAAVPGLNRVFTPNAASASLEESIHATHHGNGGRFSLCRPPDLAHHDRWWNLSAEEVPSSHERKAAPLKRWSCLPIKSYNKPASERLTLVRLALESKPDGVIRQKLLSKLRYTSTATLSLLAAEDAGVSLDCCSPVSRKSL